MPKILIFLFSLLTFSACCTEPASELATLQEFWLPAGENVRIDNHTWLQYVRLVSDTRCPIHADCIWEGEAKVALQLKSDTITDFELITISSQNPNNHTKTIDDYVIELKQVLPLPGAESVAKILVKVSPKY